MQAIDRMIAESENPPYWTYTPKGVEGPARRKSAAPEPERPQAAHLGVRRWWEFLIYVARCERRDRQWAVTKQQLDY
jgi:hypothetical protein